MTRKVLKLRDNFKVVTEDNQRLVIEKYCSSYNTRGGINPPCWHDDYFLTREDIEKIYNFIKENERE